MEDTATGATLFAAVDQLRFPITRSLLRFLQAGGEIGSPRQQKRCNGEQSSRPLHLPASASQRDPPSWIPLFVLRTLSRTRKFAEEVVPGHSHGIRRGSLSGRGGGDVGEPGILAGWFGSRLTTRFVRELPPLPHRRWRRLPRSARSSSRIFDVLGWGGIAGSPADGHGTMRLNHWRSSNCARSVHSPWLLDAQGSSAMSVVQLIAFGCLFRLVLKRSTTKEAIHAAQRWSDAPLQGRGRVLYTTPRKPPSREHLYPEVHARERRSSRSAILRSAGRRSADRMLHKAAASDQRPSACARPQDSRARASHSSRACTSG